MKTKIPRVLPINTRSLEIGAIIIVPIASPSNSWDAERFNPITPAKVTAAQSTPGPTSIAEFAVGSIAMAKIDITSDAKSTMPTTTSLLRASNRNSFSINTQIMASGPFNWTSPHVYLRNLTVSHLVGRIGNHCQKLVAVSSDDD